MAKQPVSDLFSTLKSYAQKLSDGERTPAEIAAALNDWAHESGQTLKAKITEEVESAVRKMGFVKREEFDRLAAQVAAMNGGSPVKKAAPKKTGAKKATAKKTTVKKATVKKAAPKKKAVKK